MNGSPCFQAILAGPVPGPAQRQGPAQIRLPVPLPGKLAKSTVNSLNMLRYALHFLKKELEMNSRYEEKLLIKLITSDMNEV
jgi:hypothetical protein